MTYSSESVASVGIVVVLALAMFIPLFTTKETPCPYSSDGKHLFEPFPDALAPFGFPCRFCGRDA